MRVAILPNLTFSNLEGESEFLQARQLARDVVASGENAFFYIVVPGWFETQPKPEKGIVYLKDWSEKYKSFHDRSSSIPMEFLEWFNTRIGRYQIDAVYTTRTGAVYQMVKCLQDFRWTGPLVPVVLDENMSISEKTPYYIGDADLVARSMGYASASWNFFDTSFEKQRGIDVCRKFLSASVVREILKKTSVVPRGLSVKRVDDLTRGVKRSDKFQIMFGNRLNQSKKPDKLMELYNKFFAFGRDVNVVITAPTKGRILERIRDKAHLIIHTGLDSDSFVKKCAESHVVVETTVFGGFSIGLSEIILAGPVVILPRLKWIRVLVGDELWNSYPFFFDTYEEAAVLLRKVYKDFESADRAMDPMRRYWREHYDSAVLSMQLYSKMKELSVSELPFLCSKKNVELLRSAAEKVSEPFTLEELYTKMVDESDVMRKSDMLNPLRGRWSMWGVYKWLCSNGYTDLCDSEIPRFVRRDSYDKK